MEKVVLLLCTLAVTVYLAGTAWEDHKSCEVTRWKHLIGGIPASFLFLCNMCSYSLEENAMVLAFSLVYIVIGYVGVYGFADGLVLANLSLFFGSIGGVCGSGAVFLLMILASFSFLGCHVVKSVADRKKVFQNVAGPLIPHILAGYVTFLFIMFFMRV